MVEFKIDHDSHVPLHVQVEQLLRELIQKKEYRRGKLLPGEEEMSKKLGISRNTFRAAMNKLVYEGLVVRKKGVGTKVNNHVVRTQLTAWSSFTREMNSKGIPFHDIEKRVSWEAASPEIARYLEIAEGVEVSRLERLRGESDYPVVLFVSYFHPRVGINKEETFDGPLYQLLEEKYHTVPRLSKEEISAILPNESLRERLEIGLAEVPILLRKRVVCDAAERPIEFCYVYYRADKFVYQINIKRE